MPDTGSWSAPAPLAAAHERDAFASGEPTLDHWLRHRALGNEIRGTSRTYVACVDRRVFAYYCLATGSVGSALAPGRLRRNMPDPIPVMVLGRLAVDRQWQGRGVGRALLRDAVLRTLQVSEMVGVKALMVHALSEEAGRFYGPLGFYPSPTHPRTLFLPLAAVGG